MTWALDWSSSCNLFWSASGKKHQAAGNSASMTFQLCLSKMLFHFYPQVLYCFRALHGLIQKTKNIRFHHKIWERRGVEVMNGAEPAVECARAHTMRNVTAFLWVSEGDKHHSSQPDCLDASDEHLKGVTPVKKHLCVNYRTSPTMVTV